MVEDEDAGDAILDSARSAGLDVEIRCVRDVPALCAALEDRPADLAIIDSTSAAIAAAEPIAVIRHYAPGLPVALITGRDAGELLAQRSDGEPLDLFSRGSARPLAALLPELSSSASLHRRTRSAPRISDAADGTDETHRSFVAVAEHLPECLWLYDVAEQRVVFVNAAFSRLWGLPADTLLADPFAWLRQLPPDHAVRLGRALDGSRYGGIDEEFRIVRSAGDTRWVRLRTFPVRDAKGIAINVVGMASDITHRVEQNDALQRLTHYDPLTALPNRLLVHERLSKAVAVAGASRTRVAVLFIDLDRFKIVNDTLGHHVGDQLLRLAASRLTACVREDDTVGRLGGDEFAVIFADVEGADHAAALATRIGETMLQPFHIDDDELFISASIGITLYPDDAKEMSELVRNADTAMYRAKEAGRSNYQFYTAELNQRARQRLTLENDLRRAMARGEFELHYQPKVSCRDGRVVGVEALLRWQHPERGKVYPAEFVPLLEETGTIIDVGAWVLGEACARVAQWRREGLGPISVSVNISGRQLESVGLAGAVGAALDASGLDPSALELELTESVLMRDAPAAISILQQLKAMGVAISVDDFGTGYSSLAYLKRFPLDRLKVDRSFVQDITADPGDASITRAIITMAHELALEVVAEGVETYGQLRMLRANHCDEIQGYLFCRALSASDLEALLRSGRRLELDPARSAASVSPMPPAGLTEWHRQVPESLHPQAAPMLGVDDDGILVFFNNAAERLLGPQHALLGLEAAEVLPENLLSLIDGDGGPAAVEIGRQRFHARAWTLGGNALVRGTIFVLDPKETV